MPIVSDVFDYTSGTAPGPAGATISSTKAAQRWTDVKSALNTAQSIVRGGTGGSTAVQGSDNLSTSDTIASATETDLSTVTGVNVTITGTTTITSFGTEQEGAKRFITFADALILTHNATSLILPGGANITTSANACAIAVSLGSGNWQVLHYQDGLTPSGIVQQSAFDANTILAANADDTPLALTVAEQTLVGRITGGNIDDLTATQARTLLNVEDGADATNTANVTAAGALMDSEVTNLALVKAVTTAVDATWETGTSTTPAIPSAANIAAAIAALAGGTPTTAGAVGTYSICRNESGNTVTAGGDVSGASLEFASWNTSGNFTPDGTPSGTWRNFGSRVFDDGYSIFQRIS